MTTPPVVKERNTSLGIELDPVLVFLFLATLIIVSLVMMYFFLFLPSIKNIDTAVNENHLAVGGRAKDAVERFMREKIIFLQSKSEEITLHGIHDSRELSFLFSPFMKYDMSFQAVYTVDERGFLMNFLSVPELKARPIQNYSSSQLFEKIHTGHNYVSPIFFSKNTDPMVTLAVPFKPDPKKEAYGALVADINLLFLWDLIKTLKVGDQGRTYVVDERGNVAGDADVYLALSGVNVIFRGVVKEVLDKQEIVLGGNYVNEHHREVRATAIPVTFLGWGIIVEQPEKEITDAKNKIIFIIISISIVILVLLFFLIKGALRLVKSSALLKEREEEIITLVQNLTDGVIEHDEHNMIILINPVAQEILGITEQNVLYHKVGDALPAALDPYENIRHVFSLRLQESTPSYRMLSYVPLGKGGDVHIGELNIEKPVPRNLVIIESSFFIVGTQGVEKRIVKIIRDITREHLITQLKSDFITIAAHQLRTPLSAVKWTFRMILDGDLGTLTPKQEEFLQRGYDTNERMILLVGDLLRVSRIEEGKFGYQFREGDFVACVENIVKEYTPVFNRKKLIIDFWKPPRPQIFFFDPERMKIVFTNIFDNAINYTLEGGSIAIAVEEQEGFVVVSIKDSGVGIPERQIHRVFSKFFRGENVVRLQTEGSGLGLYIVRNIVNAHGGTVWIDSKEGEGTKVSFRLPLRRELMPQEEKPAEYFSEFMRQL